MKELSIEQKTQAYDGNYRTYTELINRLENVKDAIKKQNYGIAMDILCKPYPVFQITTSTELKESEDENVRNFISNELMCLRAVEYNSGGKDSDRYNELTEAIAWIEKQGEQGKIDYDEELKRCKANPIYFFDKYVKVKLKEQKPAWSEDDEKILNLIIARLHSHKNVEAEEYGKDYHWLKSLKDRVQPKQEWSEEDVSHIRYLIECLEHCKKGVALTMTISTSQEYIDWLKSLRPQNRWKPSEEEMVALEHAINCYSGISPTNANEVFILEIMKDRLKKLKDE